MELNTTGIALLCVYFFSNKSKIILWSQIKHSKNYLISYTKPGQSMSNLRTWFNKQNQVPNLSPPPFSLSKISLSQRKNLKKLEGVS